MQFKYISLGIHQRYEMHGGALWNVYDIAYNSILRKIFKIVLGLDLELVYK